VTNAGVATRPLDSSSGPLVVRCQSNLSHASGARGAPEA